MILMIHNKQPLKLQKINKTNLVSYIYPLYMDATRMFARAAIDKSLGALEFQSHSSLRICADEAPSASHLARL